MQLVFTCDLRDSKGVVKFASGTIKDYPKATWAMIAQAAGMELNEFTMPAVDVQNAAVATAQVKRAEREQHVLRRKVRS